MHIISKQPWCIGGCWHESGGAKEKELVGNRDLRQYKRLRSRFRQDELGLRQNGGLRFTFRKNVRLSFWVRHDCGLQGYGHMFRLQMNVCQEQVQGMLNWEVLSIEEAIESLAALTEAPSLDDFICILKKCRKRKNIAYAKQVYAEIRHHGLDGHRVLGNYVVPMFVECGSIYDAQQVFDNLDCRYEHAWTSLIQGYTECGESEHALHLFEEMQEDGVYPSMFTLQALLKACARVQYVERGQELHAVIATKGYEGDIFVSNTLVDMYAKCGLLAEAQEVFDKLPVRDIVSWSALILGYAEHGLGENALDCFDRMRSEGTSLDAITFVCGVKACGCAGALGRGRELHLEIVTEGLECDAFIGTSLVDMYAKCGSVSDAEDVFCGIQVRFVVSWNALMAGYLFNDLCEKALKCLEKMQLEGVFPNAITYVCSLKACGSIEAIDWGRAIHDEIVKRGLEGGNYVGSTLVDMYARCGSLAEAQELLDELPIRDVVSWTALIAGYAEHGLGEKALNCLKQMQLEDVPENDITFVCSLKACGSIGAINRGREIHVELVKEGFERDPFVSNTLVDMYAKCGSLSEAHEMFDELSIRIIISWNALITGHARQGETELAFHLFERMREEGAQPNGVTYLCVLTLCSHSGLVEKGHEYFEAMGKDHGVALSIKHHNIMVDLFARAGQLNEAREIIKWMPCQPNYVTWKTMLSGCRKWNNVELGREAFGCLMKFDEKPLAAFILMYNIYADAHMWEEAKKIDEAMIANVQTLTNPGKIWIEIGGFMHAFMVGDMQHPQTGDILAKLEHIYAKMETENGLACHANDNASKDVFGRNSEVLALVYGIINTPPGKPMAVVRNLHVNNECHGMTMLVSKVERCMIVCRDASKLHVFKNGACSCVFIGDVGTSSV